jgi:two-component system KDP operon response regulator KdpE
MAKTDSHILVVDDEPAILRFLQSNLQLASYVVRTANCGADGLRLAQDAAPDLILLDLGLPDIDGLQVLQQLRHCSDVPIIIITARDDEETMVAGLNLGADDYLVKPFSGRALQARIEAVLRRYRATTPVAERAAYQVGPLYVDVAGRQVTLDGSPMCLTPIEFALLVELVRSAGRVRLHGELLAAVWGPEYRDDITVLRAAIYRLRHKIEPDPANPTFIRTESGVGYSFRQPDASTPSTAPAVSEPSPHATPAPAPHYTFAESTS